MPTQFANVERLVSAAVDRVHGETTLISPRKSGEFTRGAADPDRQSQTVIGVIDLNPVTVRAREKSEYDGYRPELDGEKVHVSYTATRLASMPRKGDQITAVDQPGQPKFQIVSVEDDGLGRVLCRCVPGGT